MIELIQHQSMLAAHDPELPTLGIVYADFVTGAAGHRGRLVSARPSHLLRACKVGATPIRVLDAFAGLGRDGFELARAGASVTMCERHPIVWQLLSDGLRRAAEAPETAEIVERIELLACGDAQAAIEAWSGPRPEVVYLDPMYPADKGGAQVRKQSQLLRQLAGGDDAGPEVLLLALELATQRVVVKRPANAPTLLDGRPGAPQPTGAVRTSATRYDIYPATARLR